MTKMSIPTADNSYVDALLICVEEGLIIYDKNGNIERVNPVAETMLGIKEKNIRGKKVVDAWPVKDLSNKPIAYSKSPVARTSITGKVITQKMYYSRKSGNQLTVLVKVSPILVKGKVMGIIEIFRDITKEELLIKAKYDFISVASHQLRTPISTERWLLEILLDEEFTGKLNNKQKDALNKIANSNKRLADILDSLITTARVDSDRLEISSLTNELSK